MHTHEHKPDLRETIGNHITLIHKLKILIIYKIKLLVD